MKGMKPLDIIASKRMGNTFACIVSMTFDPSSQTGIVTFTSPDYMVNLDFSGSLTPYPEEDVQRLLRLLPKLLYSLHSRLEDAPIELSRQEPGNMEQSPL